MSFELDNQFRFLKKIELFNKIKNEIRNRLYLLKVNDVKEIETLISLMFELEIFAIKFNSLRDPAGFVVKLVRKLIHSFNSAFPNEKRSSDESELMRFLIYGPGIDPEKLRYQLEKIEKDIPHKSSEFCQARIRKIINKFCGGEEK